MPIREGRSSAGTGPARLHPRRRTGFLGCSSATLSRSGEGTRMSSGRQADVSGCLHAAYGDPALRRCPPVAGPCPGEDPSSASFRHQTHGQPRRIEDSCARPSRLRVPSAPRRGIAPPSGGREPRSSPRHREISRSVHVGALRAGERLRSDPCTETSSCARAAHREQLRMLLSSGPQTRRACAIGF